MFENVDGRTDNGRTDDGVTGILIANLGAFGSGELKNIHKISTILEGSVIFFTGRLKPFKLSGPLLQPNGRQPSKYNCFFIHNLVIHG